MFYYLNSTSCVTGDLYNGILQTYPFAAQSLYTNFSHIKKQQQKNNQNTTTVCY